MWRGKGIRHYSVMLMLKLADPGLEVNCQSPQVDEGWWGG